MNISLIPRHIKITPSANEFSFSLSNYYALNFLIVLADFLYIVQYNWM